MTMQQEIRNYIKEIHKKKTGENKDYFSEEDRNRIVDYMVRIHGDKKYKTERDELWACLWDEMKYYIRKKIHEKRGNYSEDQMSDLESYICSDLYENLMKYKKKENIGLLTWADKWAMDTMMRELAERLGFKSKYRFRMACRVKICLEELKQAGKYSREMLIAEIRKIYNQKHKEVGTLAIERALSNVSRLGGNVEYRDQISCVY
jgi:hypothetical protein